VEEAEAIHLGMEQKGKVDSHFLQCGLAPVLVWEMVHQLHMQAWQTHLSVERMVEE